MADLPTDPLIAAWVALFRASAGLIAAVQTEVRAAGSPPLEWYDVLWDLERAPEEGRRPFELKGRLLLAQYNLSRLVDRLVRAGYVERRPCPVDGRGQMLRITDAGRALRKRTWPIYQAAIQKHIGRRLTEPQAILLGGMLGQLIDGFNTETADCGESSAGSPEKATVA